MPSIEAIKCSLDTYVKKEHNIIKDKPTDEDWERISRQINKIVTHKLAPPYTYRGVIHINGHSKTIEETFLGDT